ncbi:uncharacterized protein LOC134669394 [Cydia fagiglandana]|uniref:uncharacterized protein LOC134669394 n=1 Tax=Cydia fagiglandana TaxID=1458189 RepID=UPI002FEE2D5C
MDDYIDSLPDEATAIDMVRNVSDIHRAGGFEVRNWTSNSVAVLNSVPKETLGTAAVRFKVGQQHESERTLGLIWYPADDILGFDLSLKRIPSDVLEGENRPTKRLMLRVIMSIFDVLGFLAPFTIQGRIMLQEAWRLQVDWEDYIPDQIYLKWRKWVDLLKVIKDIRIPRWYCTAARNAVRDSQLATARAGEMQDCVDIKAEVPTSPPATHAPTHSATKGYDGVAASTCATTASSSKYSYYNNLQMHFFSDASTQAMSAVGYWRWEDNGTIYVAFIASKSRVMPVKQLTIPKAELQAALLSARLANAIGKEHKLTPIRRYFWCDSSTVIHWIRNKNRTYKAFEANRLGEIDDLTRVDEWRYISTKLNVADLATRDSFDLALQNEWFKGPSFLYADESEWPKDIIPTSNEETGECVAVVQVREEPACIPVPDPQRFSSWLRLTRATATVLKFIARCKGQAAEIDCAMMERAEIFLLKHAQNESFGEDLARIKVHGALHRASKLLKLSPILDEHDLLRVGGRIDAASDVPLDVKRPVILDGRHQVARLIVRHYHVKAAHGSQEMVVNEIKQRYWVIKLRPTVKLVTSRCMLCRIMKSRPQVPRMGDLPGARIEHHQRPFFHCGLDLFGPMEVAVGRRREKRYGVLFTCLTVRAIHIELVASLTTDSLIMALRRMAARRGWPRHLYSDNGTNLRGADTELRRSMEALDMDVLKAEGVNNNMDWTFIPPASPHWGGAWERLIRSVKTALKVVLKERAPRDEVLTTFMAEVENMVNGRPLVHVSVDPADGESFTPNHFLLGSSSRLPLVGEFDDSDLSLRKLWRKAQRLADMFWQRWLREILPTLVPRTKWLEERNPLKVGDLVLVVDPNSPRNMWPKGLITQVIPGGDGRIRLVEWSQASLPIRHGGVGIRQTSAVALPAFLSSAHNIEKLFRKILKTDPLINLDVPFLPEAIDSWKTACPNADLPITRHSQHQWDEPLCLLVRGNLNETSTSTTERARLLAATKWESGSWLQALPSKNLGTLLSTNTFRISLCLRLGVACVAPHLCQCGANVTCFGVQGLSCARSVGRLSRHASLNDILRRALVTAGVPAVLEPSGLARDDGKRPDGMTLVPWKMGRPLVWDATCVDTLAQSHLPGTSNRAGAGANMQPLILAACLSRLGWKP